MIPTSTFGSGTDPIFRLPLTIVREENLISRDRGWRIGRK
jgi:hypothetical protein